MTEQQNTSYPVLPLRDIVVFPHMIVPLFVGREKSVRALEAVMQEDKSILLASQRDPGEDDPSPTDIYDIGAMANVLDRLIYGYVLDFLNNSCCGLNNPFVYNIADIFIFAGAIGLIFFAEEPKKNGKSARKKAK